MKQTISIEKPVISMAQCIECKKPIPLHEAYKVTVIQRENFHPYSQTIIVGGNVQQERPIWEENISVYDPSLAAIATNWCDRTYNHYQHTHLIRTCTGYACSHEHAEQGARFAYPDFTAVESEKVSL